MSGHQAKPRSSAARFVQAHTLLHLNVARHFSRATELIVRHNLIHACFHYAQEHLKRTGRVRTRRPDHAEEKGKRICPHCRVLGLDEKRKERSDFGANEAGLAGQRSRSNVRLQPAENDRANRVQHRVPPLILLTRQRHALDYLGERAEADERDSAARPRA